MVKFKFTTKTKNFDLSALKKFLFLDLEVNQAMKKIKLLNLLS